MRKTKIIATAGPACGDEKTLRAVISSGADVIRINASHTTPQELKRWIQKVRKVAASVNPNTAILVDLQGPRVRTGKLAGGKPITLKAGQEVPIEVGGGLGTGNKIITHCREFPQMLKKGDPVLLDNGN